MQISACRFNLYYICFIVHFSLMDSITYIQIPAFPIPIHLQAQNQHGLARGSI